MLCNNCGNQLEEGDVFCGMCGNSLYQNGQSVMDTYSTKTEKKQTYTEPVSTVNNQIYTEPVNSSNGQVHTEPVNQANGQVYTEPANLMNSQAYTCPVMQENNPVYAYQQTLEARPKKKRRWPIVIFVLVFISVMAAIFSPFYLENMKKEDVKDVVEKFFEASKNNDVEKFAECIYSSLVNVEDKESLVEYMEAFSNEDVSIGRVELGTEEDVNTINKDVYAEYKTKISDVSIVYCKITKDGQKVDLRIILFLIDGEWYIDRCV